MFADSEFLRVTESVCGGCKEKGTELPGRRRLKERCVWTTSRMGRRTGGIEKDKEKRDRGD